jgi:hypothetical protein
MVPTVGFLPPPSTAGFLRCPIARTSAAESMILGQRVWGLQKNAMPRSDTNNDYNIPFAIWRKN